MNRRKFDLAFGNDDIEMDSPLSVKRRLTENPVLVVEKRKYTCTICEKQLASSGSLTRHTKTLHAVKLLLPPIIAPITAPIPSAKSVAEKWLDEALVKTKAKKAKTAKVPKIQMSVNVVLTPPVNMDYRLVMKYMKSRAELAHIKAYPNLLSRAKRLGFSSWAVDKCLAYIAEHAPIIVHFQPRLLNTFANDSKYKNAYELHRYASNTKCPRFLAESKMFNGMYDSALASDRVKYGCLNICGSASGSKPASAYGSAFMILKPHMRTRVTITPCDSFGLNATTVLATPDSYAHLLTHVLTSDADLKQALTIGSSPCVEAAAQETVENIYREIQIHGDLNFASDILAIVIPSSLRSANLSGADAFTKKHNVPIIWV